MVFIVLKPGKKLDCNPLIFVFLLKRRHFDLKKLTRSKPETRTLNRTGSKNYDGVKQALN